METKWNDATYNRPGGDRPIDAPYIYTDIEEAIKQLKEEEAWQKNDRNGITIFKSDAVTLVVTVMKENAEMPLQKTDGYVIIQTINGMVHVSTNNMTEQIAAKQILSLHPDVEYSVVAAKESAVLLTVIKTG